MSYKIDSCLIDTRTNKLCRIDTLKTTTKGDLYTVEYSDGQYRRFYSSKLDQYFKPLKDSPEGRTKQETLPNNVIRVDFINKCRIGA